MTMRTAKQRRKIVLLAGKKAAPSSAFVSQTARDADSVRGAVRDNLHPLAFDPLTVSYPNAFAVAVTRIRIARIRVGLLHGPIGVEDIHVIRKRRTGILHEPCPDNRIDLAIRAIATATRQSQRGNCRQYESERRTGSLHGYPLVTLVANSLDKR